MSKIVDQHYLLHDQYRNSSNLDARISLHKRFSTNMYGWDRWCFDLFQIQTTARLLELGCGPASLWLENRSRIPQDWDIALSDLSAGMIDRARENLQEVDRSFQFEVIDAQSIPFDDAHFDAVIARHMLYHVPDRSKALQEIRRVLKPQGRFYCTTNGHTHLRELHDLMRRFDPTTDFGWGKTSAEIFSLADGAELAPYFSEITVQRYADDLIVTEVEPLVNYIFSMTTAAGLIDRRRAELTRFIQNEMAKTGSIHITKDTGMFIPTRT
ncbi:MAG TPA: methyltransferase domain-containing protein [Anaerolineae bacterium]|nr:methyltransferase domain-containing protein [Anaerolineae bacterium]